MTRDEAEAQLKRKAGAVIAQQREAARASVSSMLTDGTPWEDRTVAHVTALKVAEWEQAELRAEKAARSASVSLGIVVLPALAATPEEWEAQARALEASSRKVIDTTAGPVTPVKAGE